MTERVEIEGSDDHWEVRLDGAWVAGIEKDLGHFDVSWGIGNRWYDQSFPTFEEAKAFCEENAGDMQDGLDVRR